MSFGAEFYAAFPPQGNLIEIVQTKEPLQKRKHDFGSLATTSLALDDFL